MRKYTVHEVYFTGSNKSFVRTIYTDENGWFYVKWYGQFIEVYKGNYGWRTTLAY